MEKFNLRDFDPFTLQVLWLFSDHDLECFVHGFEHETTSTVGHYNAVCVISDPETVKDILNQANMAPSVFPKYMSVATDDGAEQFIRVFKTKEDWRKTLHFTIEGIAVDPDGGVIDEFNVYNTKPEDIAAIFINDPVTTINNDPRIFLKYLNITISVKANLWFDVNSLELFWIRKCRRSLSTLSLSDILPTLYRVMTDDRRWSYESFLIETDLLSYWDFPIINRMTRGTHIMPDGVALHPAVHLMARVTKEFHHQVLARYKKEPEVFDPDLLAGIEWAVTSNAPADTSRQRRLLAAEYPIDWIEMKMMFDACDPKTCSTHLIQDRIRRLRNFPITEFPVDLFDLKMYPDPHARLKKLKTIWAINNFKQDRKALMAEARTLDD